MNWLWRVWSPLSAHRLALVLGLLVAGLVSVGAVSAATTGWRVQPSPSPGGTQTRPPCCVPGSELVGVAATSATNAWAVGDRWSCPRSSPRCGNQINRTLIERWNGRVWKVQPSPNPRCSRRRAQGDVLRGVAVTSATNAWAVGSCAKRPLIEHWNGKTWKVQPALKIAIDLRGVAATSSKNAWAVGDYYKHGYRSLIEHWNGKAWKVQKRSSSRGYLSGVAATSAKNAWAVGGVSNRKALIEHWNGKTWKVQPTINIEFLLGVAATSRINAWAIENTKVVHWNGTAWKIQPSPTNPGVDDLHSVSATSPTNAWAVGEHVPGSFNFTLIEHWNGKAWKIQPSPTPHSYAGLDGVAATSATNAWAVGGYVPNCCGERTLIEHWNGNG